MSQPFILRKRWIIVGIVVLALIVGLIVWFGGCSPLDFSTIKYGFGPLAGGKAAPGTLLLPPDAKPMSGAGSGGRRSGGASETEDVVDNTRPERQPNVARANQFLDSATLDYYKGSYDEALRRLERAKWHNSTNYSLFRLSGQIFFEQSQYRKAFNDWMRATQLPNDDRSIARDLDVVKRLIRYSRNEIDRLQRDVNLHPTDRVSEAKLRELELRLKE
ncbi:MAG: hypothetical protein HQM09_22100 [Candidatus Riflebacteria bacterium]|nr:hypothetical protein [Candidatus Riflebacteria bacterium]